MLLRKFRKDLKKKYILSEGPNSYHYTEERLLEKVLRFFTQYIESNAAFMSGNQSDHSFRHYQEE